MSMVVEGIFQARAAEMEEDKRSKKKKKKQKNKTATADPSKEAAAAGHDASVAAGVLLEKDEGSVRGQLNSTCIVPKQDESSNDPAKHEVSDRSKQIACISDDEVASSCIDELKEALKRESKTSDLLRLRVSALEEQVAARDLKEANTQAEIQLLRAEIHHLDTKVGQLQGNLDNLGQERDQMLSKMVAFQTLAQQREREPQPEVIVLDSASQSGTNEAYVATKELKLQQEAASLMIEKLVAENAGLTSKINEQSLVIDQLTNNPNGDMTEEELGLKEMRDDGSVSPATLPEVNIFKEIEVDSQDQHPSQKGMVEVYVVDNHLSKNLVQVEMEDLGGIPAQVASKEEQNPGSTIKELERVEQGVVIKEVVPFSDAPLMGAPVRMISFLARFVSGADLVKKNRDLH